MRVLGVVLVLSESVGSDPRRTPPLQISESEAAGWYSPDVKNGLYGEPAAYTLVEDMLLGLVGELGREARRGTIYMCEKSK